VRTSADGASGKSHEALSFCTFASSYLTHHLGLQNPLADLKEGDGVLFYDLPCPGRSVQKIRGIDMA
jgi:hypothetical protein